MSYCIDRINFFMFKVRGHLGIHPINNSIIIELNGNFEKNEESNDLPDVLLLKNDSMLIDNNNISNLISYLIILERYLKLQKPDNVDIDIINFIKSKKKDGAGVNEISKYIVLTRRATRDRLKKLSSNGIIYVKGTSKTDPNRRYYLTHGK
jgi:hypothetical protein